MLLLVLLMKIFFNIHNTNGTLKFKVENAQNNVINIGTEKRNLYPADQSFTNTSGYTHKISGTSSIEFSSNLLVYSLAINFILYSGDTTTVRHIEQTEASGLVAPLTANSNFLIVATLNENEDGFDISFPIHNYANIINNTTQDKVILGYYATNAAGNAVVYSAFVPHLCL